MKLFKDIRESFASAMTKDHKKRMKDQEAAKAKIKAKGGVIGKPGSGVKLKEEDKDPCWKGYQQIGMKKKGGKEVPNCVPKESIEEATTGRNGVKCSAEKSQFGGYTPTCTKNGKGIYSAQQAYTDADTAKKHAEVYADAYYGYGERHAQKAVRDFVAKNKSKLRATKEEVEEGKLPPHLSKFFDKKGNLNKDAEERVKQGRKKRGLDPYTGKKLKSFDEKLKVSYKDTGTYSVVFRNKNGKVESEISAPSKEKAEKQVAIRNKKVKPSEGAWEVIKTGSVNEARKYSVLDTKKNEIIRPNITKAAAQKLVDNDPDNRIMGSPEFIHDKRTAALKENYGVMSKQAFKRQEHEFEAELDRQAEMQRKANDAMARVIWIDGKVWKKDGKPVEFNDKKHAQNVIRALSKKSPDKDFTAGSIAYYKQEGDTLKHKLKTKK